MASRIIVLLAPFVLSMGAPVDHAAGQSAPSDGRHLTRRAMGATEAGVVTPHVKRHRLTAGKKFGHGARRGAVRNVPKMGKPSAAAGSPTPAVERTRDKAAAPESQQQDQSFKVARESAAPPVARPTEAELAAIAKTYCSNNAADAAEARVARRREKLAALEKEVTQKSSALAALAQDARNWVERREKLWSSTRDGFVETYGKMKPEAAAQQLAAMNDETATSIIMKLNARAASAILNEMGAERAARLADAALRRGSGVAPRAKSGT